MSTFLDLQDAGLDAVGVSASEQRGRLKKLINEEAKELATTLRISQPTTTLTVVAGTGNYSLSSGFTATDVAQIRDVTYLPVGQSTGRLLSQTTAARIDELRAWSNVSYPSLYAMSGVDTLLLAPIPTDAGTLTVRYTSRPAEMATDSDTPGLIPVEFHDVIWLGAAVKLARIAAPARAQGLDAWYRERLGDLRSWLTDLGGAQPIRMQRAGIFPPNHDRSTYPDGGY